MTPSQQIRNTPSSRRWAGRAVLAALALSVAWPGTAQSPASRVVAVADVHGAYPAFFGILRQTGLIDDQGRWAGGNATFVQTGDVTDRGEAIREVLDLLMALEDQAPRSEGRVVALLGNHETMNMTRFLRDVSPRVYPAFADDRSEDRRRDAYQRYARLAEARRRALGMEPFTVLTEEAWMAAHPAGLLEYIEAFGPRGRYGRWLREKDTVARIGRTIFLHGGLNPEASMASIDDINERVRADVARFDDHTQRLVDRGIILPFFTFDETLEAAKVELDWWTPRLQPDAQEPAVLTPEDRDHVRAIVDLLQVGAWSIVSPDGPLWFRGFAQWTDEVGAPAVDELLTRYNVSRFVVGHTPTASGRVVPRFERSVFLIDTGMLAEAYMGRASALEIVDGDVAAIYEDGRVELTAAAAAADAPR